MAKTPSIEIYLGGNSKDDEILRRIYSSLVSTGRGRAQNFFRMALIRGIMDMQDMWPDDVDPDEIPRIRRRKITRARNKHLDGAKEYVEPEPEVRAPVPRAEKKIETVARKQPEPEPENNESQIEEPDFVITKKFDSPTDESEEKPEDGNRFSKIAGLM